MRRIRAGYLLVVALGGLAATVMTCALAADATRPPDASTRTADGYFRAMEPRGWSFPRDHGRHDGFKTEWWYFTGNLSESGGPTTKSTIAPLPNDVGRRFGFQLTFFRTSMTASPTTRPSPWAMRDIYSAHAAVTDVSGGKFYCDDISSRGRMDLAWADEANLDVKLLNWSAILQSQQKDSRGIIALEASGDKFSYDFNCTIAAEPILEGPGGVNAKGPLPGEASYYYSMIRMPTSGHVSIGGKTFDVAGPTWMDHEFSSNPLGADQVGWDWMGLTLDDGRDVMVYRLRNASGGSAFASATIAERDGRVKYLDGSKIHLTGSEPWRSPSTGGVYPQRWHVALDGIDAMDVRTMVTDQEMHTPNSTNVDYYEGASDVLDAGGRKMGQGYLEMTGYAKPLNGM